MNVQEKIQKMESARGKNHPLSMFRAWLDAYVPDYKKLKMIQIGGTNGKGSTCQWMNRILQKEGFKVGMFTSPHLVTHQERIRINERLIPLEDWERIYDRYVRLFEEKHMTMFEMDLWMALVYFVEQEVDYALIEVGMGGRLDATTALDYIAKAITNVGKDHMEFLGNTVEEIAVEKAGIFRENIPVYTSERRCFEVLKQEAVKVKTPLYLAEYDLTGLDLSSVASYQKENLRLALSILEGLKLLDSSVLPGVISSFNWDGRFMVLRKHPLLLVDGAHNMPGIQALVSSLSAFSGHIYFSVLKEKEAEDMINLLKTLKCPITLVDFDSYRLYDLTELKKRFELEIIEFEELIDLLQTTNENSLVCGSLYFVGDVLKNL